MREEMKEKKRDMNVSAVVVVVVGDVAIAIEDSQRDTPSLDQVGKAS
jgi:hypothetical protein